MKAWHALAAGHRAALLMLAQALGFAMMGAGIRMASDRGIHVFEIAFFRNFFGLAFALPLLHRVGLAVLKTDRFHIYFLRCLIGLGAMFCGFWALAHLPLGKAVALAYSAPLFVTIGAVIVLKEDVRWRRWTAVMVGFVGVLVIVRPGWVALERDVLIALLGAVCAAGAVISIKFLSRTEPAEAIVLWMVIIMTPLSLIPAIPVWTWPDATGWLLLAGIGLLGTVSHLAVTHAYQLGDASALQAYGYAQLPLAVLFGWWLFGERLDLWVAVGAAIIVGAGLAIARREAVRRAPTVTDPRAGGG